MDHHQGLAVRLVEMIMMIEMKVFGRKSLKESFTNFLLNFFYFPNPYPKMLTAKIMQPSSLSCASPCSHC